jgi:hypothetical protein
VVKGKSNDWRIEIISVSGSVFAGWVGGEEEDAERKKFNRWVFSGGGGRGGGDIE